MKHNFRALSGALLQLMICLSCETFAVASPLQLFLPKENASEILEILNSVDFSEDALLAIPHVTFVSQESKSAAGFAVVNRVSKISRGRLDIWLMRQKPLEKSVFKNRAQPLQEVDATRAAAEYIRLTPVTEWDFVGIVVDNSTRPKTAFYFEFADTDVAPRALPLPRPMRAPCSACHSSGPRLIRPDLNSKIVHVSAQDLLLIDSWNETIGSYKIVENFVSPHEKMSFPAEQSDEEILKLSICNECHNQTDGVRNALRRKNRGSILELVNRGEMPIEESLLPIALRKCLRKWLDKKVNIAKCESLMPQGQSTTVPSHTKLGAYPKDLEAEPAHTDARVKSSPHFLSIEIDVSEGISGFKISGVQAINTQHICSSTLCKGSFELDWSESQTGIRLRDRHLKAWIAVNLAAGLKIHYEGSPFPDASGKIESRVRIAPTEAGSQVERTTHAHCSEALTQSSFQIECKAELMNISLSEVALQPPCFLGLCVHVVNAVQVRFQL